LKSALQPLSIAARIAGSATLNNVMERPLPKSLLALLLPLALAGCFSFSSSSPRAPASNTVVLPPGTTVVCSNGAPPPCQ
jgi:hypothetical protein